MKATTKTMRLAATLALAVAAMAMTNDAQADADVGPKGAVRLWSGGPYWATTNIGAEKPEYSGYYFWWGDTLGYKWENEQWVASDDSLSGFSFNSDSTLTHGKDVDTLQSEGWITADGVLAPEHDAAHVHCGEGWRMPTKDELSALNRNCDWTWTTMNGVNGYIVRGKGAYISASIFLPASGHGLGTSLKSAGSRGDDWSSVPNSDDSNAWAFIFNSDSHGAYDFSYDYGRSIRPVRMTPWTPTGPTAPAAPTLFGPVTAELPFTGDATYNGWVRNADGTLAGQLTVKAAKPAKPEKGGQSKLTVTYVPFGGKKQTIKLPNDAMPVAGDVATVAIPGVGTVKLTGDAIVGVDVDVQAGRDLLKSKDKAEKAAATAAAASKAGVWTFALGTDDGYAAFSVSVDKKGKGKLAGTLPDGTKVSARTQGVLGDGVLAVPFAYAKKGSLGLVFWVKGDGAVSISDLSASGGAFGTARPAVVAPSAAFRLADGERTFTAGEVSQKFEVSGGKWNVPKANRKAETNPNPFALKLSYKAKDGTAKGTFTVVDGKVKTKYTVVGAVVGGRFYGSAYVRNAGSAPATAE